MTEQQINNIYINCNRSGVDMDDLLRLCLDPDSGITVEGLRAAKYKKIDLLEERYSLEAEEMLWIKVSTRGSLEQLSDFIRKIKQGVFSRIHLAEAEAKQKEMAAALEDRDWMAVRSSNDISEVMAFISKIKEGTYSENYLQDALRKAEFMDWTIAKDAHDSIVLNGYIQKCNTGFYPLSHVAEAKNLLEEWESGTIVTDWEKVMAEPNMDFRVTKINEFIQCYAINPSETAQRHLEKARKELDRIADEKEAGRDWIDAKQENTILAYVTFLNKHPYSEHREEAERLIQNMKGDLLSDMKRFPFKYNREMMYDYISKNVLTMSDLVDKSDTLTDRAYSHIKRYPRLIDEQRQLPVSTLENPKSEEGNTDIFFFGVSGSGKTCVLAGLMSLTGQLGFRFDPKGPGGGGNYAMELRNYARTSMLPPQTDQNYIQVIDGEINDEENHLHKISFIEMSGEKTARFASIENAADINDLGPGAAALLSNDNNKVIFFVIDPTNEKNVELGEGNQIWVMQSDVLNCVSALLSKNKDLMKKVVAIHVILTKSDTLGNYVDRAVIQDVLNRQGYQAVLEDIKRICERYNINKQTGFHVGLYPFCVGQFMPGEVYTFDNTDSLKILRVIQKNTIPRRKRGFFDTVSEWFNS